MTSEQRTLDYCIRASGGDVRRDPADLRQGNVSRVAWGAERPRRVPVRVDGAVAVGTFPSDHAVRRHDGDRGSLSIDVYTVASPPQVPDEVWEESTGGGGGGAARWIKCYDRDAGGWAADWRLNPNVVEAPPWCDLPRRGAVVGWNGDWQCQQTFPDTFTTGKVKPATSASWTSALHIAQFGDDGWERAGDDAVFLVGQGLTATDGEICIDSTAQIVGVVAHARRREQLDPARTGQR